MKRLLPSRFLHRLNVPVAVLLALLQRTPVVRLVAEAETIFIESPIGTVLRSVLTAVASLGAIESMAGATPLVATPQEDSSGLTATVGTAVSVFYTVTGTQTPPASWQVVGSIPPGLSFSGLTGSGGIVNVTDLHLSGTPTKAGSYDVTITTYQGTNATLVPSPDYAYTITVNASGGTATAPVFTTAPQSQTVTAGASVNFTAAASGSPTPTYQWQKNGGNITGATNATLNLPSVTTTDAGSYVAVATNSAGSVSSLAATLTVSPAATGKPTFSLQPSPATIAEGTTVVFNAAADNATSYQWQLNGAPIAGATSALLVIRNAGVANAGNYTVVAGNTGGTTTSTAATLQVASVSPSEVGRLNNVSVRTFSGAGDQVLSVGFAIDGDGALGNKPLLVRVGGPVLAGFGVADTMTDPTLLIRPLGSQTVVGSNDDWAGDAQVVATADALGAFPWTNVLGKDAATTVSLAPGAYTALAAGKNNGTGVVLTEVYDATPASTFTAATPRVINVSARAQASSGNGVLTAGFFIAGSTAKTVLIRATGPTLATYGVGGVLPDPLLDLYVLNGPKLYENDNWGGSAQIAAVASSVGAFGITDLNSKDAALLVTLPPGGYTAQVSGVGGAAGVALVEVYVVP